MNRTDQVLFCRACQDAIDQLPHDGRDVNIAMAIVEINNAVLCINDPTSSTAGEHLKSALLMLRKVVEPMKPVTGVEALVPKRMTMPMAVQRAVGCIESACVIIGISFDNIK